MLLQSNIIRKGGTIVEFDGPSGPRTVIYHFKPISGADGAPHVCDVASQEHAEAMLAVPGRAFSFAAGAMPEPSQIQPAVLPPVMAPGPQQAEHLPKADDKPDPENGDNRDHLVALYTELYGQPPHPASKIETLRARIAHKQSGN